MLGLWRGGLIAGICRIFPAAGRIDAPGLLAGQRDEAGYRALLSAGLSWVPGQVTVESWGDGPDRVLTCEQLGLTTAEYCPGWELDLANHSLAQLPG